VKILFIFHEAQFTGATLALSGNVKWFSEHTDFLMSFLFLENGPLKNEFVKTGPVFLWRKENLKKRSIFRKVVDRIMKTDYQTRLLLNLKKRKYDLIYANTVMCSELIQKVAHFDTKIVWHIHELELAIRCMGTERLKAEKYVNYIIANSKSTMNNLLRYGIDKNKVSVHYPGIDIRKIQNSSLSFSARETLKIPSEAFIIGSSGTAIDRKGIWDFVSLPLIIDSIFPENKFYYLWVGKLFNKEIVEYDLEKAGLTDRIIFSGEQRDPFPYYNIFDIYVSCSKEESFGLSAIESAVLHKPLVCYKNTGGIEEIAEQSNNITIPYLNLPEMAKKIIEVYRDKDRIKELGNLAFENAKRYDNEIIMPDLYNYLKNT
jgi:glycosyltransferase involved in cell wall biosynthesis